MLGYLRYSPHYVIQVGWKLGNCFRRPLFIGLSGGDTIYANSNRRPFYRPVENSRSIFSITPNELKVILQSRNTISSPVTAIPGGQFVRVVDTGKNIGITSLKEGGTPTRYIKIFTDKMGNLITTYPVKGQ